MMILKKYIKRYKRIGIVAPNNNIISQRIIEGIVSTINQVDDLLLEFSIIQCNDNLSKLKLKTSSYLENVSFDALLTIGKSSTEIAKFLTESKRLYTPIVFGGVIEPEKSGLVKNRIYSGNHLTGLSGHPRNYALQIKKILELLKAGGLSVDTIALLFNPATTAETMNHIEQAVTYCQQHNICVAKMNIVPFDKLENELALLSGKKCIALALRDGSVATHIKKVSALCTSLGIPLITSDLESVQYGAAVGFGDYEKSIGENMATVALPILLKNITPSCIPVRTLPWSEKIFISTSSAAQQKLHLNYSSTYITTQDHIVRIT